MKKIINFFALTICSSFFCFSQIVNNKDYNFTEEQEKEIFHSYCDSVPIYIGCLSEDPSSSCKVYSCRGMGPHFLSQLFLFYDGDFIFFKRQICLNPKVTIGEMCQIIQDRNILSDEIRNDMYRSVYKIIMYDRISNSEEYNRTKCKYADTMEVYQIYRELMNTPKDIPYKLPWIMLLDLNSDESVLLLGKICGLKEEDIRREYEEEEKKP